MNPPTEKRLQPRGSDRVLFVSDPSTFARTLLPNPAREHDLRGVIDMMADAGIDLFGQEIWSQGWTAYWQSDTYEYDQRPQHQRFRNLIEQGTQPVEILVDQAHLRGLGFIAGFRMNDGHAGHNRRAGIGIAEFIESNPHLRLHDPRPGAGFQEPEPLDFTFDEVRDFTHGVIREAVTRFDVDGVELCFREPGYFPLGTGRERMHLMTDLVRRIRATLDEQATKRGRRLRLGARVFSTAGECADLGLDLPCWVRDGLLDFVCPMDTMYNDFNLPFEAWAELTRASDCMLYPGIHPWMSYRKRYQKMRIPVSWATHRALAHTMYAAGADGVSSFNHFVPAIWTAPFYPHALQAFHRLGDPGRVAAGERHYIFDPSYAGFSAFGGDGKCGTGLVKADAIELHRSEPGACGTLPFNLYEDFGQVNGASLLFRGFGLTSADELEVRLNGKRIPDGAIRRTAASDVPGLTVDSERVVDGQGYPHMQESGFLDATVSMEKPGRPFSTRCFSLTKDTVAWAKNELSVTLISGDPEAKGEKIVIDEIEVFVEPK